MVITPEEALMVLYAVEKRINRKITDQQIFDGSCTKLIIASNFNFEGKVSSSIPTSIQISTFKPTNFSKTSYTLTMQTKILFFLPKIVMVHQFPHN